MIKTHSLEALKNHIDIVDIIGSELELKKAGANFKACCPFHGESTPSFVISPAKQIYHCFGCGVGGDAIKFIQEYNRINFFEAIEKIANYYNFTLEYEDNQNSKNNDFKKVLEQMNSYYIKCLENDHIEYLQNRGLKTETIKEWEIGFAPKSNEQLNYLKNNFMNFEDASLVGVTAKDNDKVYAKFINRIMFPIRTHSGKLVGFSGRILQGDRAKYVNSPATQLFDKSRLLFGLDKAKESIYTKRIIVIVEGQLDVIMLHQEGIKTAVATLGTALTVQHIPIIAKSCKRVLVAYDGDAAGRAAAYKASVLLNAHGLEADVCFFDKDEDPASMLKAGRKEELISIMKRAMNSIEFILSTIISRFEINNPHQKNQALSETTNFLKSLPSVIVANEYKRYVAEKLNINSEYITLGQVKKEVAPAHTKSEDRAEISLFKTILEKPSYMDEMLGVLDYEAIEDNKMFQVLFENDYNNPMLIPLHIREDIPIYSKDEFISALKIKQKMYLQRKLTELSQGNDNNVFKEITSIQNKIKTIKI
jgi:DNA primase